MADPTYELGRNRGATVNVARKASGRRMNYLGGIGCIALGVAIIVIARRIASLNPKLVNRYGFTGLGETGEAPNVQCLQIWGMRLIGGLFVAGGLLILVLGS